MDSLDKVNEFLEQIDGNYEYDDMSEDKDREVNIFGQGLADRISRLPGFEDHENLQKSNEDNKSKFQCSYLSSIQSIRTIEKDKLNKALHDRMNRLAIMDRNFKIMMNKRFLSQPRSDNINLISNRANIEDQAQSTTAPNKVNRAKKQTDRNLIKFCLTKNADFLFANSKPQIPVKIDKKKDSSLNMNVDLGVNQDDSGSEFLKELDPNYEPSNQSTPRDGETVVLPETIVENKENEEEIIEKDEALPQNTYTNEERISNEEHEIPSKENIVPAKVVFK